MRHRRLAALLALWLPLAACSSDSGAAPTTGPSDEAPEARDGTTAGVELVGFDDDEEVVRLADYRGRPLVVNLFASWCPPCVREMPAIERVKQDVADEVAFLGIATNDRVEKARELVEETGITWDVARDPHGEAATTLGAVRMPTTFLIDAEGEIVEAHTGEISEGELRDLLAEHFGVEA
jgi:peroxiredoxin